MNYLNQQNRASKTPAMATLKLLLVH